jgi:type IV secretory pathway VirB6-like protein
MTHAATFDPRLLQRLFLVLFGLAGIAVMADAAFAQAMGSAGDFECVGGRAVGTMYDSGVICPTTITKDNIFSFLICQMEQLSSSLMGQMFCGMITALKPGVLAVLTLSVFFFGISFTIGLIPLRGGDFLLYLLKFAAVLGFATQSDYLIGTLYNLLISGVREGVAIAISGVFNPEDGGGTQATGASLYVLMDGFLSKAIGFATDNVGAKRDGTEDICKNAVFAAMVLMAVAFPPIFYIAVLIIVKVAMTFLRAIFGYVYALVGIAFLLTLAPFFLSFFLFKSTRGFFDKWIGYLISFTLQMVILFGFLAFVLSIDVKHLSSSLPDIVMYNEETPETTSFRMPWEYCTLCDFTVVSKTNPGQALQKDDPAFLRDGKLICKEPKKPITPLDGVSPPGGKVPDPKMMGNLLSFATTGLLSLLVLAYLVEAVLTYAASLSQMLASAGAAAAPQLGGGFSNAARNTALDIPGSGVIDQFEAAYDRGYAGGKTSLDSAGKGLVNAFSEMVTGRKGSDGKTVVEGTGIMGNFANWLSNPNRATDD